jgi:isoaspartyl peptidase/L-asparaginase-like protein (Ntn-hydrolase superfamily)
VSSKWRWEFGRSMGRSRLTVCEGAGVYYTMVRDATAATGNGAVTISECRCGGVIATLARLGRVQ